jgi:hypothetical protein
VQRAERRWDRELSPVQARSGEQGAGGGGGGAQRQGSPLHHNGALAGTSLLSAE